VTPAAVGFGSNTGCPDRAFATALRGLERTPGVRVTAVSGLWRSAPWGRLDQPEFLNGAVRLEVRLEPAPLLERLHELEDEAGRERAERWGPRPLDLDLLWYGDRTSEEARLVLPHPRLAERTFVLLPLDEVTPDWRHPRDGRSAAEMLRELVGTDRATACERIPGTRLGDPLPVAGASV
jgi:2-amino-4-hydroxy-6-hydroxymethyldihydropteridine diphosphokinase